MLGDAVTDFQLTYAVCVRAPAGDIAHAIFLCKPVNWSDVSWSTSTMTPMRPEAVKNNCFASSMSSSVFSGNSNAPTLE